METAYTLCQNGFEIPCKCNTPDIGQVQRVVLGVHGLTGSADDEIQSGIAGEMELFDAATFRFDFPAHGCNRTQKLTLQDCTESLLAVAKDAKERFPQIEDLCIFATGFGAYVTLIALDRLSMLPGNIRLVVQTPSVRMDETLLAMTGLSRETFWAMDQITFPTKRPLTVTYSFYEELCQHSALTAYSIPILILQGEQDDYIRFSDIQQFRRINEQSRLVTIPGATHRFTEDGAWDMVLDLTRDWFAFEQVLLTDWE